jgi:hypothetical protein
VKGREGGRDHQHVLLLYYNTGIGSGRWPDASTPGLLADAKTLAYVFLSPDVYPFVERADLGVPGTDQRRQFGALGDMCAPPCDGCRNAAGLESINADFVEISKLAWFHER